MMTIRHTVQTAVRGVTSHKSRSALTILGIVIGIAAIILMVSMGRGAEGLILGELEGLGAETIIVRPGREPTGPTDIAGTLFADSLKDRELQALRRGENVPDAVRVEPAVFVTGGVSYGGEIASRAQVIGASAEFMASTFDIYPAQGTLFDETDIRSRAAVAVIGSNVQEELFGAGDAVGEYISVKDVKFRVVGVFPREGASTFINWDETVIIPYTTARSYLLGISHYHEFIVRARSSDVIDQTVFDIEQTLRDMHNIDDPEKDDFFVETQQGVVDQIGTILGALTVFLSSVVAISLVVGGIGVMNIMLVSVTERTREIGLRKALGATDSDILRQFLIEAVMLTAIGGAIGIAIGSVFAFLASFVLQQAVSPAWEFVFPIGPTLLALAISAGVGLVFGSYPASQASKKSPIEALRYE